MDPRDDRDESDEEDYEVDDLHQLELDRNHNDQKLKSRFEHIFRKYEHDFEGIGDEIEIASGDIVVDNGHLQHMRHEADPGKSASSRFVKTFQEKLGYEDESTSDNDDDSEDSGEDDDEVEEDSYEDETSETQEYRSGHAHESIRPRQRDRLSPRKTMQAFGDLARPAPRLAHLLVGQGTPQPGSGVGTEHGTQDDSSIESTSGTSTPTNVLGRVPGIQESMHALQPRAKRSAVDPDAIEALGVSIANQLAQLMAGPSKGKRKQKAQTKAEKVTKQSAWDYPDLGSKPRRKRRRSPSPVAQPAPSSPAPGSPGKESLWAPDGSVRPSKRPRRERADSQTTPAVTRSKRVQLPSSSPGTSKRDVKRCWNCSLTSTPSWQKGPHGQDLCVSCARYYSHHRRMKPFDSPTPSVEVEEVNLEEVQRKEHTNDHRRRSRRRQEVDAEANDVSTVAVDEADDGDDADKAVPAADAQRLAGRSGSYSYRPLPADVSPPQRHTPPPPTGLISHVDKATQNTTSTPRSLEEHLPRRLQRSSHSNIATHTLDLSQIRQEPRQQQPDVPGTSANSHFEVIQYEPEDEVLVQEDMSEPGLTIHEYVPSLPRAKTPVRAANSATPNQESTYSANTSRTLLTSPNSRKGPYSLAEDALIIRLKEHERLTWDEIAPYFPNRSMYAVSGRYTRELKFGRNPARDFIEAQDAESTDEEGQVADPLLREDMAWNEDQDELLLELREDQELEWEEIAPLLPGHSPQAVEQRYDLLAQRGREQHHEKYGLPILQPEDIDEDKMAHGWFSPEEDAMVVRLKEVERLEWAEIGKRFRTRPLQSIQKRYSRCLDPAKRKTWATNKSDYITGTMEDRILAVDPGLAGAAGSAPFLPEEDLLIKNLKEVGRLPWDAIAQRLGGRTGNAVKHRYEYKFGRQAAEEEAERKRLQRRPFMGKVGNLPGVGVICFDTPPSPVKVNEVVNDPRKDPWKGLAGRDATSQTPTVMRAIRQQPASGTMPVVPQAQGETLIQPHQQSKTSKSGPGSRTPFTEDEDDAILQLREMQGLSWEDIALRLPGRSVNSVSSRYMEALKPAAAAETTNVRRPSQASMPSQTPNHSATQPPLQTVFRFQTPQTIGARQKHTEGTTAVQTSSVRPEQERPRARPRSSLPSTLPSTSRSQNPLLRMALDNSLRRRSHMGATFNARPSLNDNLGQAKKTRDHDIQAASQQLHREMSLSLQTPSPAAPHATNDVHTPAQEDTSSESSDGRASPVFERLLYAATKFAIQQKNPALFNRVRDIHDKNPNDERLHQLLEITSNSSVSARDVIGAIDQVVGTPQATRTNGIRQVPSPGAQPALTIGRPREATVGLMTRNPPDLARSKRANSSADSPDLQSIPPKSSPTASKSFIQWVAPDRDKQNGFSLRRSRRAAFDNASRKNAELLALPAEFIEPDVAPPTASPSPPRTRRDSNGSISSSANESSASTSDEGGPSNSTQRVTRPRERRPSAKLDPPAKDLIQQTFKANGNRAMHFRDIYAAIESGRDLPANWKNAVSRELSRSSLFERARTAGGRSGWQLATNDDASRQSSDEDSPPARNPVPCKVVSASRDNETYVPVDDGGASESTSFMGEDDAIIVNVGPKQRRIMSGTGAQSLDKNVETAPADDPRATASETQTASKPRGRPPKPRRKTLPKSAAKNRLSRKPASQAIVIADSDEEMELHLDSAPDEPDELEQPTERPSSRAFRNSLPTSDAAGPGAEQSSSKAAQKPNAATLPSSSQMFMKPHTPASALSNRKFVTPKPSAMRVPALKQTPARAQPPAIFVSRSSSVTSSKRVSFANGRRLVETPVREVDSDEDELA